jgi:SPX domain protein involved in polyphosphate accumulation
MAVEIFNRCEKKYRLDGTLFDRLQYRLSACMETDAHNESRFTYPICNIYYDTDDSYLIRKSLTKPKYKEKLRLRSYGTPDMDSRAYVEIKKKVCGVVNKRRSGITLCEAYAFLENGEIPEIKPGMNGQVLREIQYMLSQRALKPQIYLSYDRRAYFEAGNPDLRISFDTNILTRRYDLRLESGSYGEPLLADGEWLMEIKTSCAMPVWLTQILSEYKVYPSSFSKYGTEYRRSLTPAPVPETGRVMVIRPLREAAGIAVHAGAN